MKFLSRYLGDGELNKSDIYKIRKIVVMDTIGCFCLVMFLVGIIFNIVMEDSLSFLYSNIYGVMVVVIGFAVKKITKNVSYFVNISVIGFYVYCLILSLYYNVNLAYYTFSLFMPIVVMYMYGKKRGLRICLSYYGFVVIRELVATSHDYQLLIQYSLYYMLVVILTYSIEWSNDIAEYLLEKEKEKKHIYDSFTGLYTKTFIMKKITELLVNKANFIVIMIDLDDFKSVNDTYGHVEGDKCIINVANSLKANSSNDYCGRFGGDEFIIVKENIFQDNEKEYFDMLLESANKSIKNYGVSVSIGYTKHIFKLNENINANEIVHMADLALYKSKNSGKNKYSENSNV